MGQPDLFPVFLKLDGRKVLLVGGGQVAAAKLGGLAKTGARVTVVAPEVAPEITSTPGVVIVLRQFIASDLDGAWLVVAAGPPSVNRRVAAAAEARAVFVNAVDDRDHGSVYTGGVFRRGGVTIAVSTEGQAPALAGLLREGLEAVVPDDIESWVNAARELRQQQRAAGVSMGQRRPLLLQALNGLYERKAERSKVTA
ncbi:MAG TPA: bifunctional precorrin-2 dehydrogenase/sirohydrochlorin ferrochelatase [Methylomirabilota bacterium]|nr:bifunctional precorrin-2 dehydrogenase/sirohydrochlorin ferrochelatase [Methylomirabilota bacterium]